MSNFIHPSISYAARRSQADGIHSFSTWKKCDAKPGTYPIVLNMKTGDFWHGDDLQATQRHARALLLAPAISPITACASLQNAIDADEFQEKLAGFKQ